MSAEIGPAALLEPAQTGLTKLAVLGERPLPSPTVVVGSAEFGLVPVALRCRDVQKSVSASSPRVVTAASMRALKRRATHPPPGASASRTQTLVLPGFGRFMPLP